MSRVQLALNVSDLEASVEFYSTLFRVQPHKRRPGYANFAVVEPPLKLVLIEAPVEARGHGTVGALNHLGVEVESTADVQAGADRLREAGLAAFDEKDTTCCYARQDKVWVHDPAGAAWEIYTITDDDPSSSTVPVNDGTCSCTTDTADSEGVSSSNDGGCCTSGAAVGTALAAACC